VKWKEFLSDFEWHLLLIALCLTMIGIVFIWSATRDSLYYANKSVLQGAFTLVSLGVLVAVLKYGYINVKRFAYAFYLFVLLLLALLPLTGGGGQAAHRWFDLGFGFRMQPSEFMKVALILALSRHLMYKSNWNKWSSLVVPFGMTLAPMILIIMQPDLGTALLFLPVLFGMIFVAGARPKHLLILVAAGVILTPFVYNSQLLRDYQRDRITSFLQHIPSLESKAKELHRAGSTDEARKLEERIRNLKRGIGYQQYFSQVSIGSGGALGQGLSAGPQNRLNYLPESHTDFIFAIIGEEWGFLGCSTVLFLFLLLVAIILGIARRTREPFGKYVCSGVGILIGTQVFVNAAITVGLLPIAGLTLPFLSYGGSSLLTSFIGLGLVLDVGVRRIREFGR
jgi:rod shape determining protein RodA